MKDYSETAHKSVEQNLGLMNVRFVHVDIDRIDAYSIERFNESLNEAGVGFGRTVVVDMEQVDYIASAGTRALLALHRQLKKHGGEVILLDIRPDSQVRQSLDTSGFSEIFRQEQSGI